MCTSMAQEYPLNQALIAHAVVAIARDDVTVRACRCCGTWGIDCLCSFRVFGERDQAIPLVTGVGCDQPIRSRGRHHPHGPVIGGGGGDITGMQSHARPMSRPKNEGCSTRISFFTMLQSHRVSHHAHTWAANR